LFPLYVFSYLKIYQKTHYFIKKGKNGKKQEARSKQEKARSKQEKARRKQEKAKRKKGGVKGDPLVLLRV
jgi:predicted NACHT family NTPase